MDITDVRRWFDDHIIELGNADKFSLDQIEIVDDKILINGHNNYELILTETWPDDWKFGTWGGYYVFRLSGKNFQFKQFPYIKQLQFYSTTCESLELPTCHLFQLSINARTLRYLNAQHVDCFYVDVMHCKELNDNSKLPKAKERLTIPMDYALKLVKVGKMPPCEKHCEINIC